MPNDILNNFMAEAYDFINNPEGTATRTRRQERQIDFGTGASR